MLRARVRMPVPMGAYTRSGSGVGAKTKVSLRRGCRSIYMLVLEGLPLAAVEMRRRRCHFLLLAGVETALENKRRRRSSRQH